MGNLRIVRVSQFQDHWSFKLYDHQSFAILVIDRVSGFAGFRDLTICGFLRILELWIFKFWSFGILGFLELWILTIFGFVDFDDFWS